MVIAVPPMAAPVQARLALSAGLLTLAEKPGAATAVALRQISEDAFLAADKMVVAYNRRYQSHICHTRALISGQILTAIQCHWTGPFSSRYRSKQTYRHSVSRGDGVLLDTACHIFDTLAYLGIGPLSSERVVLASHAEQADTEATIELHTRSRAATVSVRIRDGDEDWRISIFGPAGHLDLTPTRLAGAWAGEAVDVAGHGIRRPVDDLLALGQRQTTCGATLTEAVAVLERIDEARAIAERKSAWRRPRAKPLGRLNGGC